jgi:5-methylcytosine-specific restriction endonuclease McrA
MKTKYNKEKLFLIVKECVCIRDVLRKLDLKLTGGSHAHIKKLIDRYEIDTTHFLGQAVHCGQKSNNNKKHWTERLVYRKDSDRRQHANILRRSLVESGREYKCVVCNNTGLWNNEPLILEVDHKNNNWLDDRSDNLDFICPNCHSQKTSKTGKIL